MDHSVSIQELDRRRAEAERRFIRAAWWLGVALVGLTACWTVLIILITHRILEKL